ncbi:MAG TPA: N-acetylmuramic acid 6-phosphate etherase [Bacteroidota bacterium]|nr:N-acetylmuramic acid 6-phosphate etherase [Bacteroidota bacterium]
MKKDKSLFDQLSKLTTEKRNRRSDRIDTLSTIGALRVINREDQTISRAVRKEIPYIAKAVELVVDAFRGGARLIYVGAGTSGRLGILDASECPPTFGVDPALVQGIIAGGKKAVFESQEGAEDREGDGAQAMRKLKVHRKDVVCGIAASMRTPYVIGAMREAKRSGAKVIFVTTNPRSRFRDRQFKEVQKLVDVAICPEVGPEVIMGSTRMKSGTAQKLILNMITTVAMIRLGKVYGNMMVDLRMNSHKLEERARRVLMMATGVDYDTASEVLDNAGGHVKTAIVMIKANIGLSQARARLKRHKGFVRLAIEKEYRK